jgi:hypothetical protein
VKPLCIFEPRFSSHFFNFMSSSCSSPAAPTASAAEPKSSYYLLRVVELVDFERFDHLYFSALSAPLSAAPVNASIDSTSHISVKASIDTVSSAFFVCAGCNAVFDSVNPDADGRQVVRISADKSKAEVLCVKCAPFKLIST